MWGSYSPVEGTWSPPTAWENLRPEHVGVELDGLPGVPAAERGVVELLAQHSAHPLVDRPPAVLVTTSRPVDPDGSLPRTSGDRIGGRLAVAVDRSVYGCVDSMPVSTTIRVSEATRDRVAALAKSTGRPMTELLEEAVDALERRLFFDELRSRYAELRSDPDAWAQIEAERAAESSSLPDSSGVSPRRGEVWLVDFGEPVGREQAGRRPAVVVSADQLNDSPAGVVIVVPCTTARRRLPSHIELEPGRPDSMRSATPSARTSSPSPTSGSSADWARRPRSALRDRPRCGSCSTSEPSPGAAPPDPSAVRLPGGRTAGQPMLRCRSACSERARSEAGPARPV